MKMQSDNKQRLAKSIRTLISDLDRTAKLYRYREDAEYLEIRQYLVEKAEQLQQESVEYD